MGGGGTTTTSGLIPAELRGLYRGSADALLNQQQANPLGQYNEANPMQVAGTNPFMDMGMSLIAGGAQPSGVDALSLQSILRGVGMAGAGPTTGQYDYGNEASLADIGGFLNPTFGTGAGLDGFDMRGGALQKLPQGSYGQASPTPDYSPVGGAAGQIGSGAEKGLQGPLPPIGGGGGGVGPGGGGAGGGGVPGRGGRPGGGMGADFMGQGYADFVAANGARPSAGHWDANNKWVPGNAQAVYDWDAKLAASGAGGHLDPNGNKVINAAGAGHGAPVSVVTPTGQVSGYTGGGFQNGRLAGGGAPMSAAPDGVPTPAKDKPKQPTRDTRSVKR